MNWKQRYSHSDINDSEELKKHLNEHHEIWDMDRGGVGYNFDMNDYGHNELKEIHNSSHEIPKGNRIYLHDNPENTFEDSREQDHSHD